MPQNHSKEILSNNLYRSRKQQTADGEEFLRLNYRKVTRSVIFSPEVQITQTFKTSSPTFVFQEDWDWN